MSTKPASPVEVWTVPWGNARTLTSQNQPVRGTESQGIDTPNLRGTDSRLLVGVTGVC